MFFLWLSNLESWSTIIRNFGLVIAAGIALWFAKKRIAVSDRQAETAQRGLLNERYQKGAEMLGSKVLSVRLGGIYALHRLAEDEPEQYHVLIMRLFCAFVSYPTEDKDYMAGLEATKNKPHRIREDVQAAMRAIGTRSAGDIKLEKSEKFRLSGYPLYSSDARRHVWSRTRMDAGGHSTGESRRFYRFRSEICDQTWPPRRARSRSAAPEASIHLGQCLDPVN